VVVGGCFFCQNLNVKLHIVTLVLDGMPFLPMQLATFNRMDTSLVDWHWHIVEGAASNTGSTRWCQPQIPRFSRDGSNALLHTWLNHPRISIRSRMMWEGGKDEMFNAALGDVFEPGVLLQVDVDELWTPEQLETLAGFFNAYPEIVCARFFCRYFVGPNLIVTSADTYGNKSGEWLRAWRFTPGMKLRSHEPPVLDGALSPCASREQTKECNLVFDHWSYVFEHQVAYKEEFYGYRDAVKHWKRLRDFGKFPAKLGDFLPWVNDEAVVDRAFK